MSNAERFAITGASGFIGGQLCAALTAAGHPVTRLDRTPPRAPYGARSVTGDLSSAAALRELTQGAQIVVHAAAYVHKRPRKRSEERSVYEINVEGTRRVLEACRAQPTPPFVILLSSVAVHGPATHELDESAPCRPLTHYARSKLAAEELLANEIRSGRLRGCVLRPCAVFGDGCPGNLALIARALRAGLLPLVDAGRNRKSLTHVSTVVDAVRWVAAHQANTDGEHYIVADDDSYPLASIAKWVAQALGRAPRTVSLPGALLRPAARGLDAACRYLPLAAPSFTSLLETYAGSAAFSNARLRATGFVVASPTPRALPHTRF